jgi:hypothetical protein
VKNNFPIFVPAITKILNVSLSTGVFPDILKHAIINPIIKKPALDPTELKHYRPVSNIKFLSKVIEKHVVNNITGHMLRHGLGEPLQSAYRKAHSTETPLVKVKNDIMGAIHNQKGMFLVLLDLSAAFDTVSHDLLFDRMEREIGLTGTALEWLKSYFCGRSTSVCVNGAISVKQELCYGLPQGSTVGPLSFSVYTIPIGRIIQHYGLSYHLYADDIQIYTTFNPSNHSTISSALATITSCIKDISLWLTINLLKLNNDKTEFFVAISPHNKRRMPPVSLQIGSETIMPSEKIRNLGVIFDSQMTMADQISALSRSVAFHLRNISRIRRYLDFETCNHIVRSLVLSRLDYGNALLAGVNAKEIARLQRLQNWAVKLIFCKSRRDHASPLLNQLHWLPVNGRIKFKILLYVYKCLNGFAPEYLTSCLTLYSPTREGLRSASDVTRLVVHKIHNRTLKSAADKTFYYLAPKLWNALPSFIRCARTTSIFKKGLKSHLFT